MVLLAVCMGVTSLKYYYLLYIPFVILFVILTILLTKTKRIYKQILIAFILTLYNKNLLMFTQLLSTLRILLMRYPVEKRKNDTVVQYHVTKFFQRHFVFKQNFHNLPSKPTIIVANYVRDRLENIACIMLPIPLCVVMGNGFITNIRLHKIVKHVFGTKKTSGEYEIVRDHIKEKLNNGISIFSYSVRPFIDDHIGKVRSGMFRMAKELGVTITPVYFDHIDYKCGFVLEQNYSVVVGDSLYVKNIEEDVYRVKKFFRDTSRELKRVKYLPQ